jgi:hypothetical protein
MKRNGLYLLVKSHVHGSNYTTARGTAVTRREYDNKVTPTNLSRGELEQAHRDGLFNDDEYHARKNWHDIGSNVTRPELDAARDEGLLNDDEYDEISRTVAPAIPHDHYGIEAHGTREGSRLKPERWRKTFASAAHLDKWTVDHYADVYGQRDLVEHEAHPQSAGGKRQRR